MKILTLAAVATTTLLLGATAAHAESNPGFYAAIDAQHHVIDYKSSVSGLENDHDGLNFAVGVRPHQNFGVELGYFDTTSETASGVTTEFSGVALDGIGYLPITKDQRFELLGSLGVVRQRGEASAPGASDRIKETKFRLGAGAQYKLTDHLSARLRVLYTDADFDIANSYTTYSLGVAYRF